MMLRVKSFFLFLSFQLIIYNVVVFAQAKTNDQKCYELTQLPLHYKIETNKVIDQPSQKLLVNIPVTYMHTLDSVALKSNSMNAGNAPKLYEVQTEQVVLAPATSEWVIVGFDPNCKEANPDDCAIREKRMVPEKVKTINTYKLLEDYSSNGFTFKNYKRVDVYEMMEKPKKKKIELPETYTSVQTKTLLNPKPQFDTLEVLCPKLMTKEIIRGVQQLLQNAGYQVDDIPGMAGEGTIEALSAYQKDHELPIGNFNLATLLYMGILP